MHLRNTLDIKNPNLVRRYGVKTLKERLKEKVEVNKETGCWEWQGAMKSGKKCYGTMIVNNEQKAAHRMAYQEWKGELEDGKFICHTCDNQRCINPEHLYQGTALDNTGDMIRRGRCTSAKLTREQVKLIRRLYKKYKGKLTIKELAEEFDIGISTFHHCAVGHSYRHIR